MLSFAAALFVFLALSLGTVTAHRLWFTPRLRVEERLRVLGTAGRSHAEPVPREGTAFRRVSSSIPALRDFLSDSGWAARANQELERAGVNLRVGEYLLIRLFAGVLLFTLGLLIMGFRPPGFLLGIPLGVIGYMLPALYVLLRRRRRMRALEGQLVEWITLVANSLRAGFAFLPAVDAAAHQMSPPISDELKRLLLDTQLGASAEQALLDMGRRVSSYDLDMVITAILIQRSSGGNLSEVLDNVAETMRERDRIRGEIRSLTAQQRLTGNILAVYPSILALLIFLVIPDVMSRLWTDPVGIGMLVVAGILQILGFLLIRRIVAIDI